MRRREFISLLGGAAAAWPLAARAQQNVGPVIGFLYSQTSDGFPEPLREFRQALKESGYVEGDNLAIEYGWAQNQAGRLRSLTADFVRERPDALLIGSGPYFYARRVQLALLSARYGIPTMYTQRQYVEAGGLLSYGANVSGAWRQVGLYIGRILKGAKPADLPVVQASKFEFVINADTARTLDISVPPSLLSVANEVIE
jgi:putative tryptophan/tyrosine transport system substrate-binding protein